MKNKTDRKDDHVQDSGCPVSPEKYEPNAKNVNLAIQGGGAHGAYAWGVIDRLLQDGRIEFEGICATSAGSMNAVVLAYGNRTNGRGGARAALYRFWKRIGEIGVQPIAANTF